MTIASRNPNDRVGVYYKTLDAFTTYRDEPVTVPVSMPSIYQGHKDVSVWSPVMSGDAVPVAQYVANAMKQDIAAGYVLLHVKVEGHVKWKVGSWVSGGYHLFITCPALQRRAFKEGHSCHFTSHLTSLLAQMDGSAILGRKF